MSTTAHTALSLDLTCEQVLAACHGDAELLDRLIAHATRQRNRWAAHERKCQSLAQFAAAETAAQQALTWELLHAKFTGARRHVPVSAPLAS